MGFAPNKIHRAVLYATDSNTTTIRGHLCFCGVSNRENPLTWAGFIPIERGVGHVKSPTGVCSQGFSPNKTHRAVTKATDSDTATIREHLFFCAGSKLWQPTKMGRIYL
jgi:hypothetical protein